MSPVSKDKVVFITGGARGVGAEVARRLHAKGAKLVLTDLDEPPLHEADADIIETGSSTAYLAQASGAPIKIINSPVDKPTDSIVVTKDVTSFADLVGKTWAISSAGRSLRILRTPRAFRVGAAPGSAAARSASNDCNILQFVTGRISGESHSTLQAF